MRIMSKDKYSPMTPHSFVPTPKMWAVWMAQDDDGTQDFWVEPVLAITVEPCRITNQDKEIDKVIYQYKPIVLSNDGVEELFDDDCENAVSTTVIADDEKDAIKKTTQILEIKMKQKIVFTAASKRALEKALSANKGK